MDSVGLQQIGLFTIEGAALIIIIYILKRSKEQEHALREEFQVILSSIGDLVIATDRDGSIQYMNAHSQQMFGRKFHDAKNNHVLKILQLKDTQAGDQLKESLNKVLLQGKLLSVLTPVPFKVSDDTMLFFQYTLAPLRDMHARNIGVVLIFRDVTDQKNMEDQREVLLGSISHELKNHMTSLQGYSHILQKRLEHSKVGDVPDLIDKLNNKILTMSKMISSMLDLSKIKMGKLDMNLEDFNFEELLVNIISDQQVSTGRHINVKGSLKYFVKADKIRIGQVLTNLISNSIKYSSKDKDITVKIEEDKHNAKISVIDKGQGIPEEKISKIFQPFYRAANSHDRATISGSGLGLYISKEIVKLNGGEILVKSKEGNGSTFTFTLPLAEALEPSKKPRSQTGIMNRIRDLLNIDYRFGK